VAVIDLIGRCDMEFGPDNPFLLVEKILEKIQAPIKLVEIHAEATSEKLAMAYMLDGKVSAVWGTHTHVPTADAQILPKGTGYVTDLGMTGPQHRVLGIRPDLSIAKFRGDLYHRYQWAPGPTKLEAVLFTIDTATKKCRKAERVDLFDEDPAQR
jgi:calcineurin-like phosphoesterase